jgi:hypothetical protein
VLKARPDNAHQALAPGFPIGMRFHSAPVIRHADAKPMELGHTICADGSWRLFVFADRHETRLRKLLRYLEIDPARDIFEMRGIDRGAGCIVIVRPDQYVADVMALDDDARLGRAFAGVLI